MESKTPPSDALVGWLRRQRWFASKTQAIAAVEVEDTVPLGRGRITIVTVRFRDGSSDRYVVPLRTGDAAGRRGDEPGGGGEQILDALDDPVFGSALLDVVARQQEIPGDRGALRGRRTRAFPDLGRDLSVRRLAGEQSNTSLAFDGALILKLFRRLRDGVNPEQEITRFLTERTTFANTPRLAGYLEYDSGSGAASTLAVVQEFVAGAHDGWQWMLDQLRTFADRAHAGAAPVSPPSVRELGRPMLTALHRLGLRTGQLHQALASSTDDPDFAPEPITESDRERWAANVRTQIESARAAVGRQLAVEIPDVSDGLAGLRRAVKIRHHGDFHLGQTLYREADADFVIIDFEGEPLRPLAERRQKHAAVRDVAGMRRSIHYAAASVSPEGAGEWLTAWEAEAVHAFTTGYREATRGAAFVPTADGDFERAVAVFELEKAAYEIVYEANNRPDWLPIPLRGLVSAAAAVAARSAGAA